MEESQFIAWIKRIQETQEEEIDCSQCFELVSPLVDREIAGKSLEPELLLVKQHVNQCKVCREEYELLRELARLEAGGTPLSVDDLRKKIQKAKEK